MWVIIPVSPGASFPSLPSLSFPRFYRRHSRAGRKPVKTSMGPRLRGDDDGLNRDDGGLNGDDGGLNGEDSIWEFPDSLSSPG